MVERRCRPGTLLAAAAAASAASAGGGASTIPGIFAVPSRSPRPSPVSAAPTLATPGFAAGNTTGDNTPAGGTTAFPALSSSAACTATPAGGAICRWAPPCTIPSPQAGAGVGFSVVVWSAPGWPSRPQAHQSDFTRTRRCWQASRASRYIAFTPGFGAGPWAMPKHKELVVNMLSGCPSRAPSRATTLELTSRNRKGATTPGLCLSISHGRPRARAPCRDRGAALYMHREFPSIST